MVSGRSYRCSRILPIKVQSIQVMPFEKLDDIVGKQKTIARRDAISENGLCIHVGRKGPATKWQYSFHAPEVNKLVKLVLNRRNIDSKITPSNASKSKVNMCIFLSFNIANIHTHARTFEIPRFKVANLAELSRSFLVVDYSCLAIGNTGTLFTGTISARGSISYLWFCAELIS